MEHDQFFSVAFVSIAVALAPDNYKDTPAAKAGLDNIRKYLKANPIPPRRVPVRLDVSRMLGGGYALRLRFAAALAGPCMRCLRDAAPLLEIDAREVDRPGEGEQLDSPYVHEERLDLAAWTRDAFALGAPVKVLCREDCAGLCPVCAADLNEAGPGHAHERAPDARWAKLSELKLE